MNHDQFMRRAIELARQCQPHDTKRTPRLGVLITRGDAILAQTHRGTGVKGDDDHAEVIACRDVAAPEQIAGATVYTTLEPCTHHTRRSTSEPCTDLLIRHHVSKVVIGILDPNQAVCGRGLNQLQQADIEVEMFPHSLAREVRTGNADFIRAQQTYSPTIITPRAGDVIELIAKQPGKYYKEHLVEFECNLPPDLTICVMVQDGANWWPQKWPVSRIQNTNRYSTTVGHGWYGMRTIHVVKANAFGMAVVDFHKRVITQNEKRTEYLRNELKDLNLPADFWKNIPSNYQALQFNELPNGLDSLASVTVEVRKPK